VKMTSAYRLLRVKDGQPHTLFHGHCGSRNPGKKGKSPGFTSGWHVLPTKEQCVDYLGRFKDTSDIVVCRVTINRVREKPRSKVFLSKYMKIDSYDWAIALQEHGHA
jgi:hypothetical protein